MVLVRLGAGLTEINGGLGGVRYRRDRCGQHIEAPRNYVDPGSNAQLRQRRAFKAAMNAWKMYHWDIFELLAWQDWSDTQPQNNKKGETFYFTAFNAFMHVNIIRNLHDWEPIFEPPWGISSPYPD